MTPPFPAVENQDSSAINTFFRPSFRFAFPFIKFLAARKIRETPPPHPQQRVAEQRGKKTNCLMDVRYVLLRKGNDLLVVVDNLFETRRLAETIEI